VEREDRYSPSADPRERHAERTNVARLCFEKGVLLAWYVVPTGKAKSAAGFPEKQREVLEKLRLLRNQLKEDSK